MVNRSRRTSKKRKPRKPRKPRSRYKSKKKIKRKSKLLRLSRAGMQAQAYEQERKDEQRRQTPRLTKRRDPGTPQKKIVDDHYISEIPICKSHSDAIFSKEYHDENPNCDLINLRNGFFKQRGSETEGVFNVIKAVDGVENTLCFVCHNRGIDGDRDCVYIRNTNYCLWGGCAGYPNLINFCGTCSACLAP